MFVYVYRSTDYGQIKPFRPQPWIINIQLPQLGTPTWAFVSNIAVSDPEMSEGGGGGQET